MIQTLFFINEPEPFDNFPEIFRPWEDESEEEEEDFEK